MVRKDLLLLPGEQRGREFDHLNLLGSVKTEGVLKRHSRFLADGEANLGKPQTGKPVLLSSG